MWVGPAVWRKPGKNMDACYEKETNRVWDIDGAVAGTGGLGIKMYRNQKQAGTAPWLGFGLGPKPKPNLNPNPNHPNPNLQILTTLTLTLSRSKRWRSASRSRRARARPCSPRTSPRSRLGLRVRVIGLGI